MNENGSADARDLDEMAQFITSARRRVRTLNTVLAEDGLREDLWRIMHLLSDKHGMLMGAIADELALPAATTTRLVDELTDTGMVFRRPAPDDGRKALAYLSAAGEKRLSKVNSLLLSRLFSPTVAHSSAEPRLSSHIPA